MRDDKPPRAVRWREFSTEQRVGLLMDDQDQTDGSIADVTDRLGKILWALVGLLISTSTGVILFALDLATKKP